MAKNAIIVMFCVALSLFSGVAYAFEWTADAILPIGSDEVGYGVKYSRPGYGLGVSWDVTSHFTEPGWQIIDAEYQKIILRGDIAYLNWQDKKDYIDWSFTRVPIFLGTRFFLFHFMQSFYVEGGVEYTFVEGRYLYKGPLYGISSPGYSTKHRANAPGISLGLGWEFLMGKHLVLGINTRVHITADPFGSEAISLGYRF